MRKTYAYKIIGLLLISCLLLCTGTVFAGQEAVSDVKQNFSIDDAIKRAVEQSKELKRISSGIKQKDIQYEDLSDSVRGEIDYTNLAPGEDTVYTNFFNTASGLRIAKKNLENQKKLAIIDTKAAYFDIFAKKDNYAAVQDSVRLAQIKLSQENARFNVGASTTAQVQTAETSLAGAKTNLAEAQKNLDASYDLLNTLLNYDLETRLELTSAPEYKSYSVDKIEDIVTKAVNNSYEIWSVKEAATLAEKLKIYEKYYSIGRENEAQARLDVSTTKDDMIQSVRDLCNSIKAMDIKHVQLLQQQKDAKEKLRVAKLQKDVGMVTADAVVTLDVTAKQVNAQIRSLVIEHINAIDNLKRLTGEPVNEESTEEQSNSSSKEVKSQSSEQTAGVEQTNRSVEKKNIIFWVGSDKYYAQGVFNLMNTKPYIKDGYTYVPVRYLAYAIGLAESDIVWDANTNNVQLTKGDKSISLAIGNNTMIINGTDKSMDVAPEIFDGSAMLPARYVAEAFGYEVIWDAAAQTVQIKLL